jgi:hypothetical protein
LAASAVLLGGCASASYDIRVTALARSETGKPKFYRIVEQTVEAKHQPLYQTAGKVVRSALASKGLTEVTGPAHADLAIVFNCGVGPAVTRRGVGTEPVYMLVPGPIRYETVQVGTNANGTPIYQTYARQDPPTHQLSGYRDIPIDVTILKKILRLKAIDPHTSTGDGPPTVVWTVDAMFESEDKNIEKLLPVLAAASMVYAGKTTEGTATIRITESDPDVKAIKRGP